MSPSSWGVGVESLRGWGKQAEIDDGVKPGVTSADAARIKELRINGVVSSVQRVHDALRRSAIAAATTELQEEIEVFARIPLPALPSGGA